MSCIYVFVCVILQMEMYQAGYYTEDFRTQEVPAGFDFGSYGKPISLTV